MSKKGYMTMGELNASLEAHEKQQVIIDYLITQLAARNREIKSQERTITYLQGLEEELLYLKAELEDGCQCACNEYDEELSESAKKQAGLPPYEPQYSSTGYPIYDNIVKGTE